VINLREKLMVAYLGLSDPKPPPEQPYQLPGTEPAREPTTLQDRPLTTKDASALLPKNIG
jgi:hypothetical protein